MQDKALYKLITDHRYLFWSVAQEDLAQLSIGVVVEHFLRYGDTRAIARLFDIVGLEEVAGVFYRQIGQKRVNYHPRTVHFFDLYFQRHAQRNTVT